MAAPIPQEQPTQSQSNTLGITALVLGIVAVPIGLLLTFVAIIPAVLAIIFGGIGVKKANRGEVGNKDIAMWGMWLGIVVTALVAVFIVVTVVIWIIVSATAAANGNL